MRKDKEIAIKMRRKGMSYRQIKSEMKIPLSTLSEWFRDEKWSKEIEGRLRKEAETASAVRIVELNRLRGINLEKIYREAQSEAHVDFEKLKYNPLFIAGLMLYWGEGTKNPRTNVQLANSDPVLIRLYIFFLRNICKIPTSKIRAHILIYPDHEERITQSYWIKTTGLSRENFSKSVVIKGRHAKRRLGWGVCIICVPSLYFKQKMLEWIKLLPRELMEKRYYEKIAGAA